MRIAVTGGSGAIGRYVCDEFAQAGHEVVSIDRLPPSKERAFIEVDLRDPDDTRNALEGFDQVIHLAAIPTAIPGKAVETIGDNTVTSFNVFEAVRLNGIRRVIYGCSDSSTGFGIHHVPLKPSYVPLDEEHPLWPHEAYSLSKHFGERIAQTYARAYGTEAISLRYNWVWVKRSKADAANIVAHARSGEFKAESAWFGGYISVRDVARACLVAGEFRFDPGSDVPFEAFFLNARITFYPIPTLDVLRAIYGELPEIKDPTYFEKNPFASVFDIRKAQRMLGWEPQDDWHNFDQWAF